MINNKFKKILPKYLSKDHKKKFKEIRDDIENKSDIVNWLGKVYNYNSYLEISTHSTGNFFDKVNEEIFTRKECLNYYSPFTSIKNMIKEFLMNTTQRDHNFKLRNYQSSLDIIKNNHSKFDVILVDPFHTFEQSLKDINTALDLLSPDGVIIVHDCNPKDKKITGNRWTKGDWSGQTYESFIYFRIFNPLIESCVVDIDYGCGIIRPSHSPFDSSTFSKKTELSDISNWEYFSKNRKKLLNLIDVEEFKNHFKK